MRRLYFAYGSNLDTAQMLRRCPGALVVGAAVLHDHELAFTGMSRSWSGGVATIRPKLGAQVSGAVYALRRVNWMSLDWYEGVPRLYVRASRRVRLSQDRELTATVYVRSQDAAPRLPSHAYLASIRQGYADFGLAEDALWAAVEQARAHGDGDER